MARRIRINLALYAMLTLLISGSVAAQEAPGKYWVFFTDKEGVSFDPYTYFDVKAIGRRLRSNIPVNDETDRPVNESYMERIGKMATATSHHSRWFNALSITATADEVADIERLEFVKSVQPMWVLSQPAAVSKTAVKGYNAEISEQNMKLLIGQTGRMGGDLFHGKNIKGQGMRIAIFDAGFPSVDVNPAFEHIRKANRIINTHDFLTNGKNVYKHSSHGCNVLSCIAGVINGQRIGLATEAEFLLARTESGLFEPYSEEENWLAAVEWADKNGADIINSSLGYTENRYFTSDMDGKKSLVARAANMAASKGILVLNAAGNDGDGDWKFLGTPADADSVLSVGGIDFDTDMHISFSSFGPTSDKRMKPNICAYGVAMVSDKKGMEKAYGTSFATPLATGFAACAWQSERSATNMDLFKEIERSGELYPYYDYAHGYGVPQAGFFVNHHKTPEPTFEIKSSGVELSVVVDKDQFDLEGADAGAKLYYHIKNTKGYLDKYYVIAVHRYDILQFNTEDFKKGSALSIHFQGYTTSYTF